MKEIVVAGAAMGAAESARDPLDQHVVIDPELDDAVDAGAAFVQHFVERLGLRHGAGKAVQDEAVTAVFLLDTLPQHGDDHLIGHQPAAFP